MADGHRLGDVIHLRSRVRHDTAAAARARFIAARRTSAMDEASFAATLTGILGWPVTPQLVDSWAMRIVPPADALLAAEMVAQRSIPATTPKVRSITRTDPPTTGRGTSDGPVRGAVAGRALQQIRESLGLSQAQLAGSLVVEADAVARWERGSQPLADAQVSTLRHLTRHLGLLGAHPRALARIETAVDVDLLITQVLEDDGSGDPLEHPLASWVTTREANELLGLAVAGARPLLAPGDRAAFFHRIREATERTVAGGECGAAVLLRRQVVYMLAAWDQSEDGWLAGELDREVSRHQMWSPAWVATRSLAVARSVGGDPSALRRFIDVRLDGCDELESANLNYWAYWIGDGAGWATSDSFMVGDLGVGGPLLAHLVENLDPDTPYLELSVHSVWALMERRPHLVYEDCGVAADLRERTAQLLDSGPGMVDLSERARRELTQVHYATRMARGTR